MSLNANQLALLERYARLLNDQRRAVAALRAEATAAPLAARMDAYGAALTAELARVAGLQQPAGAASRLAALAPASNLQRALHTNGVDGGTGRGLPPFDPNILFEWRRANMRMDDPLPGDAFRQLHDKIRGRIARLLGREEEAAAEAIMGVVEKINALDPVEARWGVIFHPDTPPDVRAALQPLIRYRAQQCAYADPQQALFEAQRNEDPYAFRLRHGQAHGDVDPAKLPYYLLLVGPPTALSWRFQYGLDAQHAVGRLDFPDAAGYAAYVRSLIAHESPESYQALFGPPLAPWKARRRALAFFAPDHDAATALSAAHLSGALYEYYAAQAAGDAGLHVHAPITAAAANKAALHALLTRGDDAPGVIFTATHGLYYQRDDARQRLDQGALLCPGPQTLPETEPVPPGLFFGADDIQPGDRFDGLLLFAFGCYTAGTPVGNDFPNMEFLMPTEIAAAPFTSRLAQRLLTQGALAVVGHVERAWHFSFAWQANAQIGVYRSLLDAVLAGKPLGYAMEYFNARFLDVNHHLTTLDVLDYELNERGMDCFDLWAARNDARGFVLLGDPLVRAPMDSP